MFAKAPFVNIMSIKNYWESFLAMLFPPVCMSCECVLLQQELFICTACLFHLPINDHHLFEENELTKRMLGKTHIETGAAYFTFSKSSLVQTLIHKLKYKQGIAIGDYLGFCLGEQLKESTLYDDIDLILPLPLHPKKKKKRGYNQSESIAGGVARAMSLPVNTLDFQRVIDTASQTKKNRMERYTNVENAFTCIHPEAFANKHILLVDDVLTTGATLASASRVLLESCACRVSVAVLALA